MPEIAESTKLLDIRSRIITIRGVQVMLDRDLAMLYQVPTKRLNEQVRRNICRFPEEFMFALSKEETKELVANCDRFNVLKHSSVPMTAFTEHGILMLSSVLKSEVAVQVNIRIMREFVAMRRALASLSPVLVRLDAVERRQLLDQTHNEERFKLILDAMQAKTFPPQKVFFNGDVFDAEAFATNDIARFNEQYGGLMVTTSRNFHDRFLIIDDKDIYLFGASLKNLGEKCFVVVKLDATNIPKLKERI